jgi:2-isopropylmalate synthase
VLEGQRLADVFAGFKQRADQIGEINDAELTAIIAAVTAAGASAQMDKTYAAAG